MRLYKHKLKITATFLVAAAVLIPAMMFGAHQIIDSTSFANATGGNLEYSTCKNEGDKCAKAILYTSGDIEGTLEFIFDDAIYTYDENHKYVDVSNNIIYQVPINSQSVSDIPWLAENCSGEILSVSFTENFYNFKPTSTSYWFYAHASGNASILSYVTNSGYLNTSNVDNMSHMFEWAGHESTIFLLELSAWDTSNVTDMSYMFYRAGFKSNSWAIDGISNWDTSKVTNMSYMFSAAAGNTEEDFSLDLSSWDTSNVTDMSCMFGGKIVGAGSKAKTWSIGDISSWDTSKVTNMSRMFGGMLGVGFYADAFSLDFSFWDTSNVTDMSYMFWNVPNLTTIYVGSDWNTDNVQLSDNMFELSFDVEGLLIGGAGTKYSVNNPSDKTYAHIDEGEANPGYFTKGVFMVSFDNQGYGIQPENQIIKHHNKITKPQSPAATNYVFYGWFKEADCVNAWDFDNDIVTEDVTLYANWVPSAEPEPQPEPVPGEDIDVPNTGFENTEKHRETILIVLPIILFIVFIVYRVYARKKQHVKFD